MAPILTRRRWTPPPTAKVNTNHPLARGLMSCHLPLGNGMKAAAGGDVHVLAPDLAGVNGTTGAGVFGDGTALNVTGARAEATLPPEMKMADNVTVMAVYHRYAAPSATVGLYGAIYNNANGSPNLCYALLDLTSNNIRLDYNTAGGGLVSLTGTGQNTVGPHIAIGTIQSTAQELYVDGARANAGAGAWSGGISYSATSLLSTGAYSGVTTRTPNFVLHMGAAWDRVLTAAEIQMLSDDPFCFIKR